MARLLLFALDQRSLRASQSLGPHFYTILGFGVGLFFGWVIFLVFTGGRWFLVLTDATTFVSSSLHSLLTPPFRCDDEVECIYHESWLTWMHSSRRRCWTWSPSCWGQLLWRSWGTISLGWVAGEVDLLLILEVEFILEIPMMFDLHF
jgi:hypothetical protein